MNKILNFIQEKRLASIIIILVLTTLVYSNIFPNEFVWDDPDFYKNWTALYSFQNIPDLLTGDLPSQHGGVYRPLRSVIQLFIFQTFNPDNLFIYHLTSLLIHFAGIVAVYFLVELLTKKRKLAFLTALIFGLHPIHVEAITYFTTSIDIIGAGFFLWAIYFYFNNKNKFNYLISIALAWLAFFTYEIALVLPIVIILIELFKENFNWQIIKQKIKYYVPYFAGVILWLILRVSLDVGSRVLSTSIETTLFSRLLTVSKAIIKYIYLLFVPYPLNIYHKIDFSWSLGEPKVLLSMLFIIALLITAIVLARKQKIISFSIFWFFICLAPVANIFPTGIVMAEKYTYLASVSVCLILGWLIYKLLKRNNQLLKITGFIIILIIGISYGYLTYARNFDWQDNETLWSKTLIQRPDYGRVYNNLGFIYYQQEKYSEAINYLEQAQEKEPNLGVIYKNLGDVYDELGEYKKAIENYEKAIELESEIAEIYNNLGNVYQKTNDLDKALERYEKAIEVDSTYFMAYSNIGVIYLIKEEYVEAKEYFEEALEISSNFGLAHHGLAIVYINNQDFKKAVEHYEKSMAFSPEIIDNYSHLASLYQNQGNGQEAIEILKKGIIANPNNAQLHTNLAIILANNGLFQQAEIGLRKALEIDPNYTQAKEVLNQVIEASKN